MMEDRTAVLAVSTILLAGLVLGYVYLDTGDEPESMFQGERSPMDQRYVNEYEPLQQAEWQLEQELTDGTSVDIHEVTRYPGAEPTEQDLERAWNLYSETYTTAEANGWFDIENALDDGYRNFDDRHYVNEEYYFDDRNLDPQRPESLVYYPKPGSGDGDDAELVLAGVMYTMHDLEAEGEQVAGPLTVWHYHGLRERDCFSGRLDEGREFEIACNEGDMGEFRGPEMIHVWFLEHPEGPFASRMTIPDDRIEEPKMKAEEEFRSYAHEKYDRYMKGSRVD